MRLTKLPCFLCYSELSPRRTLKSMTIQNKSKRWSFVPVKFTTNCSMNANAVVVQMWLLSDWSRLHRLHSIVWPTTAICIRTPKSSLHNKNPSKSTYIVPLPRFPSGLLLLTQHFCPVQEHGRLLVLLAEDHDRHSGD